MKAPGTANKTITLSLKMSSDVTLNKLFFGTDYKFNIWNLFAHIEAVCNEFDFNLPFNFCEALILNLFFCSSVNLSKQFGQLTPFSYFGE